MNYTVEKIALDKHSKLVWVNVSNHKYYMGAVWSYLSHGGTLKIINHN